MKGRKPIPSKLKILHGNPGKRDITPEPEPSKGRPILPEGLDEHGEAAWLEAVRLMEDMALLTIAEGPLLEMYAHAASGYRQARDAIAKTGIVLVTNKNGDADVKRNPFSVELHKYREAMLKLMIELGMTPVARARIGQVGYKNDSDPAARFIG